MVIETVIIAQDILNLVKLLQNLILFQFCLPNNSVFFPSVPWWALSGKHHYIFLLCSYSYCIAFQLEPEIRTVDGHESWSKSWSKINHKFYPVHDSQTEIGGRSTITNYHKLLKQFIVVCGKRRKQGLKEILIPLNIWFLFSVKIAKVAERQIHGHL